MCTLQNVDKAVDKKSMLGLYSVCWSLFSLVLGCFRPLLGLFGSFFDHILPPFFTVCLKYFQYLLLQLTNFCLQFPLLLQSATLMAFRVKLKLKKECQIGNNNGLWLIYLHCSFSYSSLKSPVGEYQIYRIKIGFFSLQVASKMDEV